MATTTLKKLLDLKVWQAIASAPIANAANFFTVASRGPDQTMYYVTSTTAVYAYDPNEDSWQLITSPALATFAAGTAGCWNPVGPSGTALAGSTSTTLNTNINVRGDLSARNGLNFVVRITGGTGAGQERLIESSTLGANATITVTEPWTITPDNTSTYTLYTGRLYVFGGGTIAAGSFKHWDHATQAWSGNLVITGVPTFGTDAKLISTYSYKHENIRFSGTATGGSTTTLVDSTKSWTTNQFANWQVRITAGAGAGGIRPITSNTGTTLTIPAGTALNNTSEYVVEPSDDFLYLIGNNAVTLYRYSVSGNAWVTRTPTAARGGAAVAGCSFSWVGGVTQPDWNNESAIVNGNRIYSFRGNASALLDYYDIGLNTWVSNIAYGRSQETMSTGNSYVYDGNYIYIYVAQTAAANTRWLRLDLRAPRIEPWSFVPFAAPAASGVGDGAWLAQYHDGSGEPLKFVYAVQPGGVQAHRCIVW